MFIDRAVDAYDAPQLELSAPDSLLGRTIYGELEWLWNIAWEFDDVRQWADEIGEMRLPGSGEPA
jgi:hypothetical protein